ncbi:arylesterase [Sneathiella aquimaris]|uniref:arylesterase n=1 Tax=Sneathiella aquimaris TaxID=2599305 RepID=UPI00146A26A1|nr:arylesterase [Sneathiella aquimaris]
MQKQKHDFLAYGKFTRFFNIFAVVALFFLQIQSVTANETRRLVAFGDSLTAGYGLPQTEAFTVQLEAALQKAGLDIKVENAGVSGDTSTGGLQRLDWAIGNGADFVLLELGANDALRGIEPSVTRKSLMKIIEKLQEKDIPVMLAGMKAPPNMGPEYQEEFDRIYPELAKKYKIAFYPFFLEGVASIPDLNQEDAIHPNKEGVALIVEKMTPSLVEFVSNH